MNTENQPAYPPDPADRPGPRRLFLREPGWRVALKSGTERAFCYSMAPGQDYYHRLQEGEIYFFHGDERICLACAERRGLIAHEPKRLREPASGPEADIEFDPTQLSGEIELADPKWGSPTA
jgi:hypothetical protein